MLLDKQGCLYLACINESGMESCTMSNNEKCKEVLLEKEKTRQAEINAKVRLAELDYALRMEELKLSARTQAGHAAPEPHASRPAAPLLDGWDHEETGTVSDACSTAMVLSNCHVSTTAECTEEMPREGSVTLGDTTEGREEQADAGEGIEVALEQQVQDAAQSGDSQAAELVKRFVEEHCVVGASEKVTSKEFRARLLATYGESYGRLLGPRRVGMLMHANGFEAREVQCELKRCRGFASISLKSC
ncbi:hypothetical protein KFL_010390060 [Klebsormidium nitens]|uniref:Uncharacterized protein n=1 Tax=Klebsormidium nitens TaxID=105231 RepID=A0A1Y1INQ1_KLENI|nr:hypothetical protein KFL_010390060 [Klebsormidium nitens]|eukprot:GAQ92525.1 hypothetical protein KFL_010390060 [Klebsormidium nitens]